jgi:integrase
MISHTFSSGLAGHMRRFIELRRFTGKSYDGQSLNLSRFDRFLSRQRWAGRWLTREIIRDYRSGLAYLCPVTQRCRMTVVRQFCIYLSAYEPRCHVPERGESTLHSVPRRLPFIFTKVQAGALAAQAGRLSALPFALRPHVYQTLFGLLYATGLRIGEALALNVGEVDLQKRRLFVRKGKFGKPRWLPLADSTCARLRAYLQKRLPGCSNGAESPLFVSLGGERLSKRSAAGNFQGVVRACGVARRGLIHPTLHSLRHTFACHCLLAWYRQGVDINARLPVLATYLGHADARYTYRYLHATPELLGEAERRFREHYHQITNTEVAI